MNFAAPPASVLRSPVIRAHLKTHTKRERERERERRISQGIGETHTYTLTQHQQGLHCSPPKDQIAAQHGKTCPYASLNERERERERRKKEGERHTHTNMQRGK